MECSICTENYNNIRKQVECPSCKEKALDFRITMYTD